MLNSKTLVLSVILLVITSCVPVDLDKDGFELEETEELKSGSKNIQDWKEDKDTTTVNISPITIP